MNTMSILLRSRGTNPVGQGWYSVNLFRRPSGGEWETVPFGGFPADDIRQACAKTFQYLIDNGNVLEPVQGPWGTWCVAEGYANIYVTVPPQLPPPQPQPQPQPQT